MIHILNNFGVIRKQLPEELFNKLKIECSDTSLEREPLPHKVLDSGLTEHYYLNHNKQELQSYCIDFAAEYLNEYKKAITYNLQREGKNPKQFYPADPWINYQKKNQYVPNHDHTGLVAYTVWINIPENSVFEFMYSSITGDLFKERIMIKKEMEGTMIMFPSKLVHCVEPFFNSDETRISISGNIYFE